MEKLLTLLTLTAVAVSVLAQEEQKTISDKELKNIIPDALCDWHMPPMDEVIQTGWRPPTIQDVANWHKVPPEQMASVLEEIIRERLPILEKREDNNMTRRTATQARTCISALEVFHSANTLALLKECVLSSDGSIRDNAVISYVTIARATSIPFIQRAFAEGRVNNSWLVYTRVEDVIAELKKENKTADVERFSVFLKDRLQTEANFFCVKKLDEILCANVDGYTDNPQRQTTLKRIKVLEQEMREQERMMNNFNP